MPSFKLQKLSMKHASTRAASTDPSLKCDLHSAEPAAVGGVYILIVRLTQCNKLHRCQVCLSP